MDPDIKAANVAPACSNNHGVYWAVLLLFVLVGLAYSNSLDAIWTLDDDPNILQNSRLHIKDLQPETLFQTFFSPLHPDQDGQPGLNRPLAHLSFALNWYFGKDSPAGYRLVNMFIHFLVAFVLFLVIRDLLDTPNMRGKNPGREGSIALIGAALWAVNPIQTQAVVYIVQRMASLACLFYLLAIWCYIRGRASEARRRRTAFFVLTMVSFLAGVGSKENAILLPATLLLLEFSFFQDWSQPSVRRRFSYVLSSGLCMLLIGGWLFSSGKLDALLNYSNRLFTPWERLLTQPRIVLFYLSQIFYPVPGRLSIVHDVELSRSLFDPWTTLPAIFSVLALICFGVWQMRKRPMLSFAILFYFLNHAIESSVIPLELIYEHRNYLPSLFLFAPVAIGLQSLIDHYRAQGSTFYRVVALFIFLLITGFGAGTYIRNLAWLDPKTFWEDAAHKAPLSMRPLHNLAYYHYEKHGDYEKAYELYQRELGLRSYDRKELSSVHVNLANYYYRKGEYSQASEHLAQAHAAFPDFALVRYLQAFVLFKAGQPEKALDTLRPLVAERRHSFDEHYLMAQILLQTGNREDAIVHLQNCLHVLPDSAKAQTLMGIALSLKGNPERAEWFLGLVLNRSPSDKQALLWMIDCQLQRSEPAAAGGYASQFLEGVATDQIEGSIRKAIDNNLMPVDTRERLSRWLWMHAHEQTSLTLKSSP
jgi:tetratricopeptide (TPR) repeat protein